jgi:hypothetical protein
LAALESACNNRDFLRESVVMLDKDGLQRVAAICDAVESQDVTRLQSILCPEDGSCRIVLFIIGMHNPKSERTCPLSRNNSASAK